MAKGLCRRAFLKRIMNVRVLPPLSNARLFDEDIFNHNILWSVKKKNQYIENLVSFFEDCEKASDWGRLTRHGSLAGQIRREGF